MFLGFDNLFYDVARSHGLVLYFIFVIVFLALAGWAGFKNAKAKRVLLDWQSFLLFQASTVALLLAIAALVGHAPLELMAAALALPFIAWLVQHLFVSLGFYSEAAGSTNLWDRQVMLRSSYPIFHLVLAAYTLILFVAQIGLLVWAAVLFDPGAMNDPAYQAKIAFIVLVLPSALGVVTIYLSALIILLSKYSDSGIRNFVFANVISAGVNASVGIFGPFYVYREGFGMPSLTLMGMVAATLGIILIVGPYFIGVARWGRFTKERRRMRVDMCSRALTLADWRDCTYRTAQLQKLIRDLAREQKRLLDGPSPLLKFAYLLIIGGFLEDEVTEQSRERRIWWLNQMGFSDDPLTKLSKYAEDVEIQAKGWFIQLSDISRNAPETLLQVGHPLVDHFMRLTEILKWVVSADPDIRYASGDMLQTEANEEKRSQKTMPAWVFTAGSSIVPQGIHQFGPQISTWWAGAWHWLRDFGSVYFHS